MPTQYANLSKNSTIPNVAGGVLWADDVNKNFYLYGGEFSSVPQPFQLWLYDTILNQWNQTAQPSTQVNRLSYGGSVAVSQMAAGFWYGGYLNNRTNPGWNSVQQATSQLIKYDFNTNGFSNSTGPDAIGRAEGSMNFIPASAAGVLVYFGGAQYPYGNSTAVGQDMSQILLYDIGDSKWYTQSATGDIPANRRKFCSGAAWAKDQSSYNIYLYGGFGFGENATGFDDVYILSMPTFTWIKWYPTEAGTPYPHGDLSCTVIGGNQMIVMGGNFTNDTICDVPSIQGQHNLNLGKDDPTNAKWVSFQNNITGYNVPSEIIAVVGGGPKGGATNKSPSGGFGNPALGIYFQQQASFTARTATRALPTATTSPTPTPTPKKSSSNTGAIAGGVVGGVLGLALIAFVIWFCLRKRKQARSNREANTTNSHFGGNNHVSQNPPSTGDGAGSEYWSDPKFAVVSDSLAPHSHAGSSHPGSVGSPVPYYSAAGSPPPMNPDGTYGYVHPSQRGATTDMPYFPPPGENRHESDALRPASNVQELPGVKSPVPSDMYRPMPQRKQVGSPTNYS